MIIGDIEDLLRINQCFWLLYLGNNPNIRITNDSPKISDILRLP
jgi:hypothetical protein